MSLKLAIMKPCGLPLHLPLHFYISLFLPVPLSSSLSLSLPPYLSLPPCPSLFLLSKKHICAHTIPVVGFQSTSESVRESGEVVLLFVDVLNGPTDFDAVIVEISFINGSANGTSWILLIILEHSLTYF